MKRVVYFIVFVLSSISFFAQDLVIGGQPVSKDQSTVEVYDSLNNFDEDLNKMIGQEFTYYNIINYTSPVFGDFYIPYPWKDGRVRSGKYESSMTAKEDWLNELKGKSGTKFKLLKVIDQENGSKGLLLVDQNGDTIRYPVGCHDAELICEGYKEKVRNLLMGKILVYGNYSAKMGYISGEDFAGKYPEPDKRRLFFTDLKSRELCYALPYGSRWTVTTLGVDTTYWGKHEILNDRENVFNRFVIIIRNDQLGDYEYYHVDHIMSGIIHGYNSEKGGNGDFNGSHLNGFVRTDDLAGEPFIWDELISTDNWNGKIPDDVYTAACTGDPAAVYAIGKAKKSLQISNDEFAKMLIDVVDCGYLNKGNSMGDNSTLKLLLDLAKEYIPGNYEMGGKCLMRAASLGYKHSTQYLIDLINQEKVSLSQSKKYLIAGASRMKLWDLAALSTYINERKPSDDLKGLSGFYLWMKDRSKSDVPQETKEKFVKYGLKEPMIKFIKGSQELIGDADLSDFLRKLE